jgi:Fic family protein
MTLAQTPYSTMVYDLRLVQRHREHLPEALIRELDAFLAHVEEQDHAYWADSPVDYLRVGAMIERRILAAEWRQDEPLSVAKLAADYSVSDATVRRALDKLWARDLLGKRKGRYVCVSRTRAVES